MSTSNPSLAHLLPPPSPQPTHTTRLRTPTTNPIPLLSSYNAKLYGRIHTPLVLGVIYLSFNVLVRDPLNTMLRLLPVMAVLQGVFCAVCLPRAGRWDATTDTGYSESGGKARPGGKVKGSSTGVVSSGGGSVGSMRRKPLGVVGSKSGAWTGGGGEESWGARVMVSLKVLNAFHAYTPPMSRLVFADLPSFHLAPPAVAPTSSSAPESLSPNTTTRATTTSTNVFQPTLLTLILTLLLPPIPLTTLSLLMGAPLYPTSLIPHTLLLSTHLSLLVFTPLFYTHGITPDAWHDVLSAWLPFDRAGVWGGFVGGFVGGWVGAVPMALDWDRDWQAWPVTVLIGIYGGWGIGRYLTVGKEGWGFGLGSGRRVDFREDDAWDIGGGEDDDDEEVKIPREKDDERVTVSGNGAVAQGTVVAGRGKKRQ